MELSETMRWILQLALAALAFVAAAWLYLDLAPRLQPTIHVVAVDPVRRLVTVTLEVTNTSRVLVMHGERGSVFHAVPLDLSAPEGRSEHVPFERDQYLRDPHRVDGWTWTDPAPVLLTTRHWYPGDKIVVQRLVHIPANAHGLHLALRVTGRTSLPVRILLPRSLRTAHQGHTNGGAESWTTTAIVTID